MQRKLKKQYEHFLSDFRRPIPKDVVSFLDSVVK